MSKTYTEQEKKINHISSDLESFIMELNPKDLDLFLGYISDILAVLDTDIAIGVLERFGEVGKEHARCIKVEYGY